MQKIVYKSILVALTVSAIVSCKPSLDTPSPSKGSIDVSKYVAIGNSITSGFADAALYYDGQMVSYPNLLAEQFRAIGGGNFVQPLMPVNSVGIGSSVNARLILKDNVVDCQGVAGLSPVPLASLGDINGLVTSIASKGPFNNMGVPGAKAITVVYPGYGDPSSLNGYNPFFTRMLSASEYSTASMLGKAAAQNPTFFSLFIGNNDVLGYALAGGASDAISPSAGPPGVGFDASIDLIINTMTTLNASGEIPKGIIGSIPDVTNIPHFTTIPYNGLTLSAAQAAQLSAAYAPLGISFTEGNNAFIIADPSVPGGIRKMKSTELVLLSTPQDSLKCKGLGSSIPLGNLHVLTETEISNIQNAVIAYNAKLKSVADAKGLAYVDVNAFMAQCKKGIAYNGITVNAAFVSGGAFSLDGVHLTPRGNALLANEFIKAINSKYGSSILQIDATKYNGVSFP